MSELPSAATGQHINAYGWAARDSSGILFSFQFTRRANGDNDITLGYSTVAFVTPTFTLPKMKHDIVGEVTKVGNNVTKFKVGDIARVECMVGRKLIAGSAIGGMKETQEMVDFAAKHNVTADVEVITMDYVNTAFERLAKGDVKYRFVIDVANTISSLF
ncbi:Alcohol dehydrogenase superfamily, zinc-type [Trema orientale]|uniref:Alcohol dehydrogenase superfamily, zinc-type n=1 Tax=Trema orientale TaxID=63057 RepID=A0A2P5EGQ9_TREOI|nr:Alcohol dehydrogenase superfamily, zinc-type [Trema orientale]